MEPVAFVTRVIRFGLAATIALVLVLAFTWIALTPGLELIFAAFLWATGFSFLALTLDMHQSMKRVLPLVATGVGLPIMAILGTKVSVGFLIMAGAVIAGWLVNWIVRKN